MMAGKSVLVVDMDPQANATKGLGIQTDDYTISIYDLIMGNDGKSVEEAVIPLPWKGLHLIPSHADLSGAEIELVDEDGRENRLKEVLSPILNNYDFVLMDTPPSLSLLTINVFSCVSEVLVPCQTHPYAFGALAELFDTIDAIREGINPDISISGIIPTLVDLRTRVANVVLDQLRTDDRYRDLVFNTMIRTNTTIAESAEVGKPVVFYRKGSNGAKDYGQLVEEFLSRG